jgi:integrase
LVLKTIVSRLARTVRSVRDIAGNLIRPRDLIAIGVAMMDEAERSTEPSWRSARLYCDGLLIMFMALCPLRPGAVSEMRIGTHLVIDANGVTVCFPPVEGRKRRLEDVPLTEELARRILRYLGHFRAMLCVGGTQHPDAVWLTAYGNPLDMISLSKRVRYALKKRTRKNFSAHMFRHSAATFIADYAPQLARMIIGLLGHSGFRTAQDYYIKGQLHAATRTYQEFVADLTRRARPKSRRGQARRRKHDT